VEQGEKLSRVLLHLYTILNFDIIIGSAAFGFNFVNIVGATLQRNCDVNVGSAA
jgi:hypothetical protein